MRLQVVEVLAGERVIVSASGLVRIVRIASGATVGELVPAETAQLSIDASARHSPSGTASLAAVPYDVSDPRMQEVAEPCTIRS